MEISKKAKTLNMDNNKKETKLSYEQLNAACDQLFLQNKELIKKNTTLENFLMNKRLEYLFKVLENSDRFFDKSFVLKCSTEIKEALTPEETKEAKED